MSWLSSYLKFCFHFFLMRKLLLRPTNSKFPRLYSKCLQNIMISGLEAADRFVKNSIILHIKVSRHAKRAKRKLLIRVHKLVETWKLVYAPFFVWLTCMVFYRWWNLESLFMLFRDKTTMSFFMGDFWFFKHLKVIENSRFNLVRPCLALIAYLSNCGLGDWIGIV